MPPDDTQQFSPTMSDQDRPSPTASDLVRPSPTTLSDQGGAGPTIQEKRREEYTLTTREVMKLFDDAGLSRNQRSIERYCDQGKMECFKDPDEMRYYITLESAEKLIAHIKEIDGRRQPVSTHTGAPRSPTDQHAVRPRPTIAHDAASVKPHTQENRESETAREAYEKNTKELEDKVFNLEVDKRAKDQMVTMLRDQLKDDRDHYGNLLQQNTDKLAKYSRRMGQLETEVKQLKAPDRHPTADDSDALDDAAAIEAEFSEATPSAHDMPANVQRHDAPQP